MARVNSDELEEEEELDVFAIHHKHATHERLRQWRAVKHYQEAGTGEIKGCPSPEGFEVRPRKLQEMVNGREMSFLQQIGMDPCRPGVVQAVSECKSAGVKANIGLAMGISGTEVAKESPDVVILDDNFASVMMRWGRAVYANIQKFIQFQLTINVAALAINFVAAVSSGSVPLQTV